MTISWASSGRASPALALALVRIETALVALSADLHPGAARYYAKIGAN